MGNLSLSEEIPFGTLIAAMYSPFEASFRPFLRLLIFTPNSANSPFFGDYRRPGIGDGNDSENEAFLAAIRSRKEGLQDWW